MLQNIHTTCSVSEIYFTITAVMYNQHYTTNQLLAQKNGYTMEIILYVIKMKKQKYDTNPHLDGQGHSE